MPSWAELEAASAMRSVMCIFGTSAKNTWVLAIFATRAPSEEISFYIDLASMIYSDSQDRVKVKQARANYPSTKIAENG